MRLQLTADVSPADVSKRPGLPPPFRNYNYGTNTSELGLLLLDCHSDSIPLRLVKRLIFSEIREWLRKNKHFWSCFPDTMKIIHQAHGAKVRTGN